MVHMNLIYKDNAEKWPRTRTEAEFSHVTGGVSSRVKGSGPVSRDGGNREALVFTSMHSTAAAADRLLINVLLSFP